MTREERHIAVLNRMLENMDVYDSIQPTTERKKAIKAAIQALSQELCDDAISRDAVLKLMDEYNAASVRQFGRPITGIASMRTDVRDLPSVTQKPIECDDAISRKAVEEITWEEPSYTDALNVLTEVRDKVRALPSVTQKSGKWQVVSDGYGDSAYICECSECKDTVWVYKNADRKWKYCPNCGARMESEVNE